LAGGEAKPRFDCLASRKEYLDENPAERFRSVFQLTEEQAAAEQAARIDGAIESWRKKVVVDTPQVLVSLRSRDRVCQQDRLKGMLHEHAKKRALRNNYRTRKEFSQVAVRVRSPGSGLGLDPNLKGLANQG